jgi:UDP-3-O-acyl-N-acetylglucosamine deacetylase
VEHVLAALAGMKIDNCLVEVDGPEPPGLDGSAHGFVQLLRQAGFRALDAKRPVWTVDAPVTVAQGDSTLTLHPAEDTGLKVSYFLDYGARSPIDRQLHTQRIDPTTFGVDIAPCRTFLLEEEATAFRKQGLGANTQISDLLVFGRRGPIDNQLRFANEPARHKILDIVGDLSLFGDDLCGHVVAYRSGHPLNIELVRALTQQMAGRQQRAA